MEIPQASLITDKYYEKDGFNYDDIQGFAYDGQLTFTPTKMGYYKILCTVTSNNTAKSVQESSIIEVNEKPSVVEPDDGWWGRNVWSVVFLSVGTLALIGIIVLLFIKPKDAETVEDGKKKSKK